jgi:fermentation-respiration switch protein FrsA (DUF1100 family)
MEGSVMKAGLFIIILVLFFLFLRYFEKRNIYFPLRTIEATPADINLDYEEISIETSDKVRLSGWFIPAQNSRRTILFFHGNGGNISHRLEKIQVLNDLKADVLIFDYRGYGESTGNPSENGLYLDAEAVYVYLLRDRKISPEKIVLYGESLGGAVAIDLAGKQRIGGIISEGSFTSIPDMAKRILPFFPSMLISSRYESIRKIQKCTSPKLFFHSSEDEIIPFEFGKQLFQAAPEPKEFVEVRGGHNDAFFVSQDVFIRKIDSFIDRL